MHIWFADCCLEMSMLVWIKLEKNGVSCGSTQIKCESRLRELDQILRASENPLDFMCQVQIIHLNIKINNWIYQKTYIFFQNFRR